MKQRAGIFAKLFHGIILHKPEQLRNVKPMRLQPRHTGSSIHFQNGYEAGFSFGSISPVIWPSSSGCMMRQLVLNAIVWITKADLQANLDPKAPAPPRQQPTPSTNFAAPVPPASDQEQPAR
jgi:hypothetical protein